MAYILVQHLHPEYGSADPSSKDIPILLFSANDEVEKISKKLTTQGYVRKPFDIPALKKTIEKWI